MEVEDLLVTCESADCDQEPVDVAALQQQLQGQEQELAVLRKQHDDVAGKLSLISLMNALAADKYHCDRKVDELSDSFAQGSGGDESLTEYLAQFRALKEQRHYRDIQWGSLDNMYRANRR